MKYRKHLLIIIPFLTVFLFLLYTVYHDVRKQTIDEFNAQQMLLARQAAKSIEKLFESYLHELTYLASIEDIIDLTAKGKSLITSYLSHADNQIRAITRVDAQGRIIYTFPLNESAIGADITYQSHVSQILKTHQPVISDVFTAVQNYQAVAYHVPVFKDKIFQGTLAVLIPFDNITRDYLENIKMRKNGYAWLISEKGVELYCPVPGHVGKNIEETSSDYPSALELSRKMMNGEQGVGIYNYSNIGKDSVKTVLKHAAYYPIELGNTFWSICVNTPEDEVLATMTGLNLKFFTLIGIMLLASVIYSYYLLKAYLVLREARKRKITESALRHSEKRFRELAELLPMIIFETDISGRLSYVNSKAFEIFGYTQDEFNKGLYAEQMLASEDRERALLNMKKIMQSEEHTPNEYTALAKTGEKIPVLIYSNPIIKDNEAAGLRGIIVDIRERKKQELEIQKSEEKFRNYVNNAPDGIVVCDISGQILDVNKALCTISGYSKEELLSFNLSNLIPEHEKEKIRTFQQSLLDTGKATADISFIRKDSSQGYWSADMVALSDNKYLGFMKDITKRKELEEQFRQSQKMEAIGHLAGGIAHDFNNLLTVINGYSEMILKFKKQDNIIENVRQILKAGQRAETLTNQLLAYSRKQILQPKVININDLLSDLEKMLRRLISENIHLDIHYGENIKNIKADPGQLQQVLMNLVVNARDAMPDGGQLKIKTSNVSVSAGAEDRQTGLKKGDYICITISDSGVGMDQSTLSRIFDPFFTTKKEGEGTGLGLSTVYGIIKQSAGNIFVESKPNQGATFRIYMKTVDDELVEDAELVTSGSTEQKSESILVIEDDYAVREFTLKTLNHYGYKTLAASNGSDALEMLDNGNNINLLLTDVIMPGESGTEVASKILAIYPDLPVIYMSGYSGETISHKGILDKNTHFIQKPFTPGKLIQKINEVLESTKIRKV